MTTLHHGHTKPGSQAIASVIEHHVPGASRTFILPLPFECFPAPGSASAFAKGVKVQMRGQKVVTTMLLS